MPPSTPQPSSVAVISAPLTTMSSEAHGEKHQHHNYEPGICPESITHSCILCRAHGPRERNTAGIPKEQQSISTPPHSLPYLLSSPFHASSIGSSPTLGTNRRHVCHRSPQTFGWIHVPPSLSPSLLPLHLSLQGRPLAHTLTLQGGKGRSCGWRALGSAVGDNKHSVVGPLDLTLTPPTTSSPPIHLSTYPHSSQSHQPALYPATTLVNVPVAIPAMFPPFGRGLGLQQPPLWRPSKPRSIRVLTVDRWYFPGAQEVHGRFIACPGY